MIKFLVEGKEILIGELRDHIRIPARFQTVGDVRIKRIHDFPFYHIIR